MTGSHPPTSGRSARPDAAGPRHAARVPFALLVGGLAVGGLCALLGLNTASAANELARHDLAVKDAGIAAQVQQLQNDVAASAAPNNLAAAAAALGMVPAGNPAFIEVGADGRVRVLGSAAPASAAPLPPPATPAAARPTTATRRPTTRPGSAHASSTTTPSAGHRSAGSHSAPATPSSPATATATLGGGVR